MADRALSGDYNLIDVYVKHVYVDESWNCRDSFTELSVLELARQIEADSLQTPVQVQPAEDVLGGIPDGYKYRLIAGFRRFTAMSQILKWETVPAFLKSGLSESEARKINFDENILRVDLTMMEQARGLARMFPKGTSIQHIADRLSRTREWVKARLALLDMPLRIQEQVTEGNLTQYDVAKLARLPPDAQLEALEKLNQAKKIYAAPGRRVSMKKLEARRRRSKTEMLNKSVQVGSRLGPGPWNYIIAWAVGNISDEELDEAIDNWDVTGIMDV